MSATTSTSPVMTETHPALKLGAMLIGLFAGWTITHWASAAVFVYTVLQIIVFIRDKFIRDKKD